MLLAAGLPLAVVVVLLVARAPAPVCAPDLMAAWSDRHHGIVPRGLAVVWLRGIHRIARRLGRVRPLAVTAAGLWCAYAAALTVVAGWPVIGAVLLVAGGVCDGLDGAVAEVAGRVSRRGALADTLADRGADAALLAGLGVLGAPGWLCGLGFAVLVGQELLRREATVITPGERPTRVVLGVAGFALAPVWSGAATLAAVAIALVCATSVLMLARSGRR